MTANEIRQKFLDFFVKRGHKIIPSSSLITPDEKNETDSTLFNTAGMQPLVPYLLGKPHPGGKRLVNFQKCVRTVDIDSVGDNTHATFFEMLGNWSLGDYFKEEAINWSYEFLTSKTEGLELDPKRLYVTVFEGDENAPTDKDAYEIWDKIFKKNNIIGERIFYMSKETNWWEAGENGPCGPDSEMYYDVTGKNAGGMTKENFLKADEKREVVEVWNDVFMQYEKKDGKIIGKLEKNSVDTGAGLERLATVVQRVDNIYDTDLLKPIIDKINEYTNSDDVKAKRIIADHVRTAVFMISDGVAPANTGRGYVLRRILRHAIYYSNMLGVKKGLIGLGLVNLIIDKYKDTYQNLANKEGTIKGQILAEEERFKNTLERGLKEFEKIISLPSQTVTGAQSSILSTSYGFPVELTIELAKQYGKVVDLNEHEIEIKKHQELSRTSSAGMFRGGLSDAGEETKKLHTATHLLRQALQDILGQEITQKGSNITSERLRFDFSFSRKMAEEEKQKVENLVNEKIKAKLRVNKVIMTKEKAEKTGASHVFGDKYGDEVSIYYIGDSIDSAYSKEFCGGPHVTNTSELGHFKIVKEEAVSAGVRRIKAILD